MGITAATLPTVAYPCAVGSAFGGVTGVVIEEILSTASRSSVNHDEAALLGMGIGAMGGATIGAIKVTFADDMKS